MLSLAVYRYNREVALLTSRDLIYLASKSWKDVIVSLLVIVNMNKSSLVVRKCTLKLQNNKSYEPQALNFLRLKVFASSKLLVKVVRFVSTRNMKTAYRALLSTRQQLMQAGLFYVAPTPSPSIHTHSTRSSMAIQTCDP